MKKRPGSREGQAILDVGCNMGYGIQIMSAKAAFAAGLDVSPPAVEAAKKHLGNAADVRLYDGSRSDFPSQSFDLITSFQVIEHISDYESYFSELVRLLRPTGVALFTTPNSLIRLDPGMKPWYDFHVREFTPGELHALLATRFEEVTVRGMFGREDLYWIERNRVELARRVARPGRKRVQALEKWNQATSADSTSHPRCPAGKAATAYLRPRGCRTIHYRRPLLPGQPVERCPRPDGNLPGTPA